VELYSKLIVFLNMRSLSMAELSELLYAARQKRERDWLMILVAFNHGFRVSELIAIKPDDVKGRVCAFGCLKHSKATIRPLFFARQSPVQRTRCSG